MTEKEIMLREMKRYLPVLESLESIPKLWHNMTKGTGIATLNGYRNAITKGEAALKEDDCVTRKKDDLVTSESNSDDASVATLRSGVGNSIEQIAETWSCNAHDSVNHRYDGMSYGTHLAMVVGCARRFIHLIPEEKRETVIAACWAHDTIEDCRKTYNDVKNVLGEDVADIVFALTNDKGKTRKERAGWKYYQGIINTQYASFVKACDRLANVQYSINANNRMIDVYRREHRDFIKILYRSQYDEIFRELESLLNNEQGAHASVATEDHSSKAADNINNQ